MTEISAFNRNVDWHGQDEIVTMVSTGTKLPLTPQDFSTCIRLQCRGFWLERVQGLLG
jgi:hypothetical protein